MDKFKHHFIFLIEVDVFVAYVSSYYGSLGPMRIEWRCGRVKSPNTCLEGANDLEGGMTHTHKEMSNITLLSKLQALLEVALVSLV